MLPVVELSLSVQVLDELASSVEQMDPDKVMVLSKRAVNTGIGPADIVENGIAKGLRRVGERFEKGEAFPLSCWNARGIPTRTHKKTSIWVRVLRAKCGVQ
jgi:methanogenic corrinoid protein MtbC1